MNTKHLLALGALLTASTAASAQQAARGPDPADPAARVPAVTYVSVIPPAPPQALAEQPSPDQNWRKANESAAGQPGHAGHHAPQPQAENKHPHKHH